MQTAVVAAVVLAIAATGALDSGGSRLSKNLEPVAPPPAVQGSGPVWFDAAGLHHGDVVEETPVDLWGVFTGGGRRRWCLVRTGALYRDPANNDVWFHPWAGQPRIVGPRLPVKVRVATRTATWPPGSRGPALSSTTPRRGGRSRGPLRHRSQVVDSIMRDHVYSGNGFDAGVGRAGGVELRRRRASSRRGHR